jgi:hypothetical protein
VCLAAFVEHLVVAERLQLRALEARPILHMRWALLRHVEEAVRVLKRKGNI